MCLCVYWFRNEHRLVFPCSVCHCDRWVAFVKFAGVIYRDQVAYKHMPLAATESASVVSRATVALSFVSSAILEPDGGTSTVTVLVCLTPHPSIFITYRSKAIRL